MPNQIQPTVPPKYCDIVMIVAAECNSINHHRVRAVSRHRAKCELVVIKNPLAAGNVAGCISAVINQVGNVLCFGRLRNVVGEIDSQVLFCSFLQHITQFDENLRNAWLKINAAAINWVEYRTFQNSLHGHQGSLRIPITIIGRVYNSFAHISFRLFRYQTLRTWGF